jgi:hypothetical protein
LHYFFPLGIKQIKKKLFELPDFLEIKSKRVYVTEKGGSAQKKEKTKNFFLFSLSKSLTSLKTARSPLHAVKRKKKRKLETHERENKEKATGNGKYSRGDRKWKKT